VGFRLGLIGVLLLVLIDPVFVPGPLLLAAGITFAGLEFPLTSRNVLVAGDLVEVYGNRLRHRRRPDGAGLPEAKRP